MNYQTQNLIRTDPKYITYLRDNSNWYKVLNRNPDKLKDMIDEMKERYSLRPSDKISNIINTFDLISSFMNEVK